MLAALAPAPAPDVGPPPGLGPDGGPEGRRWPAVAMVAALVAVTVVVGLVALGDGPSRARRGGSAVVVAAPAPAPTAGMAPTTTVVASTTTPTTTAAVPLTTLAAPTTAAPVATTALPVVPAAPAVPAGWTEVADPGLGLRVALPGTPDVDQVPDRTGAPGGRTERTVTGPGGWVLGVSTVAVAAQPSGAARLDALVAGAAADLGVAASSDVTSTVAGAPARRVRFVTATGTVSLVVVDAGPRVHTLQSFVPTGGDAVAGDARLDAAVASVVLSAAT